MAMQEIFSVSDLTEAIKGQLEAHFPVVAVQGEISNLKEQTSGHLYFTLKDEGAQLSAVLFRGHAKELSRLPKNGDRVILRGQINVYAPRGYYQIVVRKLEYTGIGELLLKLHALKQEIAARGWFQAVHKKPIPKFPKRIGVVTSPTGSVIQDIIQILTRRNTHIHLLLNPVKVQGEGAALEIARAIQEFNRYGLADVLIVGRGGGSLEDLWAFNEECVASAIFHSKIPIISAVGHETDHCIADYVADLRAPTPSSAAEIATTETSQHGQFLRSAHTRLSSQLNLLLKQHKKHLLSMHRHPFLNTSDPLLSTYFQKIDTSQEELSLAMKRHLRENRLKLEGIKKQNELLKPTAQIRSGKEKLFQIKQAIALSFQHQRQNRKNSLNPVPLRKKIDHFLLEEIRQRREKLSRLLHHLKGIDPKNLLKKGYCILFNEKKDSVILSAHAIQSKERVHLLLHDGEMQLIVEDKL
jgi:exodeoxyribonuclease VII large subunit